MCFRFLKVFNHFSLDPPLPLPELLREEADGYKNTIFQDHIFNQLLRDNYSDAEGFLDEDLTVLIESLESLVLKPWTEVKEKIIVA